MLCQKCHRNKANQYYMGNWNGNLFAAGICSDCMNDIAQQATAAGYGEVFGRMTGWYPGKTTPRTGGTDTFPEHASQELIARRRLNELKYKLEDATDREDYGEAARLRDAIAEISREEGCHES